jgi:hypothetical protein
MGPQCNSDHSIVQPFKLGDRVGVAYSSAAPSLAGGAYGAWFEGVCEKVDLRCVCAVAHRVNDKSRGQGSRGPTLQCSDSSSRIMSVLIPAFPATHDTHARTTEPGTCITIKLRAVQVHNHQKWAAAAAGPQLSVHHPRVHGAGRRPCQRCPQPVGEAAGGRSRPATEWNAPLLRTV